MPPTFERHLPTNETEPKIKLSSYHLVYMQEWYYLHFHDANIKNFNVLEIHVCNNISRLRTCKQQQLISSDGIVKTCLMWTSLTTLWKPTIETCHTKQLHFVATYLYGAGLFAVALMKIMPIAVDNRKGTATRHFINITAVWQTLCRKASSYITLNQTQQPADHEQDIILVLMVIENCPAC